MTKCSQFPIYGSGTPVKPGMYLGLFHGFKNERARQKAGDAGEWGANGPMIGPLNFAHTTYACHVKIEFENQTDAALYGFSANEYTHELVINDDGCIPFGEYQYGDWTVYIVRETR
jgi:hypothetical protein